jgi:tRNA (adenine22-N1)-methyltransferase
LKVVVENLNTEKLSERLDTVARYVPNSSKLADIGSDHAYLPCYLAKKGQISFAIAGEVAPGPFESAQKQVKADGLSEMISVRMGDGLDVLGAGEIDCIAIAGMGGALITSIIDKGKPKLDTVKRLVLQPNISAITIRKWLVENNWELLAEEILEEDGKVYEILVAEKGDPLKPYSKEQNLELLLGPYLMKSKTDAFQKKWRMEIESWKRICEQLEKAASSEETNRKKQELLQQISLVEEVLS